jgi:hypothetical protein
LGGMWTRYLSGMTCVCIASLTRSQSSVAHGLSRRCLSLWVAEGMSGLALSLPKTSSVQVRRHVGTRGGRRRGDRDGQRAQRTGVGDALMRAVSVVEMFELAQSVEQVALVLGAR